MKHIADRIQNQRKNKGISQEEQTSSSVVVGLIIMSSGYFIYCFVLRWILHSIGIRGRIPFARYH